LLQTGFVFSSSLLNRLVISTELFQLTTLFVTLYNFLALACTGYKKHKRCQKKLLDFEGNFRGQKRFVQNMNSWDKVAGRSSPVVMRCIETIFLLKRDSIMQCLKYERFKQLFSLQYLPEAGS
jgi:hypothetical protein